MLSRELARISARRFIADHVRADRSWDTFTLELYLPEQWRLRDTVHFEGKPTVENIAKFIQQSAVIR